MNLAIRPWIAAIILALLAESTASTFAGMTPAEVKAFESCKAEAEKGNPLDQFNLGIRYEDGAGVPKDQAQAVSWYRKAAEQGHAEAQINMGLCYVTGSGVAKDEIEAYAYWNQGTVEYARKKIADLEKQMTAEQIAAGKKRTKELQKEIDAKIAAKTAGR